MRNILFTAVFMVICTFVLRPQAEESGDVSGKVVDAGSKSPMQLVTIVILRNADSSVVDGAVTDAHGGFRVSGLPEGAYLAKASFMGYKEKYSRLFRIDVKRTNVNLGTLTLSSSTLTLKSVEVTSERVTLTSSIDKKVYVVSQDVMSESGSAGDLLQNIPSVQVDIDGNVSLRGAENVELLINGKNSALLAAASRADALQQIPAASIEKIEIITNPSAKYKPDGTAGIINIIMKKESGAGTNGSVGANAGNQNRYNTTANLNYNEGGLNLFGRYGFRHEHRTSSGSEARTQIDGLTNFESLYNGSRSVNAEPLSHLAAAGFDYTLDEESEAGFSVNYMYRDFNRNEESRKTYRSASGSVLSDYFRNRNGGEAQDEGEAEAYYERTFGSDEHKFRASLQSSWSAETEDNTYTTIYAAPLLPEAFDKMEVIGKVSDSELKLEYTRPLGDESVFETGYSGILCTNDFDYRGSYRNAATQVMIRDTATSSHFVHHEYIHALYGTYSNRFGGIQYLAGLRVEYTSRLSELISSSVNYPSTLSQVYPTLHLAYAPTENVELQLNYSKRANRPDEEDLNPFPEYQDPRNLRAGNPKLKPEYIHSLEAGVKWQNTLVTLIPTVYYRNKYNGFTAVTRALNDSVLLTTRENLALDHSAGAELVLNGGMNGTFSFNAGLNGFYQEIDGSNIGFGTKKSTYAWSGNLNLNVNLPASGMLQVNTNYRSARLTPQGEYKPGYVVNLGYRQEIIQDNLTLTATVSDLFKSLKREMSLNTSWLKQSSTDQRNSQVFYVGLTYFFGGKAKGGKDKLQYDENI